MRRVVRCVLGFCVLALACGDDDGGEGDGVEPVCRDGVRLSVAANDTGYVLAHIAVVSDDDLAVTLPLSESGHRFPSSLWAPDGQTLALRESGLFPGQETALVDPACEPYEATSLEGWAVAWSPDGAGLLLAKEVDAEGVRVVSYSVASVAAGRVSSPVEIASFEVGPADSESYAIDARWSPDSSTVAVGLTTREEIAGDMPGHLYLIDVSGSAGSNEPVGELRDASSFAWAPTGQAIAFADRGPGILVSFIDEPEQAYRVDDDQQSCGFSIADDQAVALWSPDGGGFLYGAEAVDGPCEIEEVRIDSDEALFVTRTFVDAYAERAPRWFRDSRHVVHMSADNRTLLWTDSPMFSSTPIATADDPYSNIAAFAFAPTWDRIAIIRTQADDDQLLITDTPGEQPAPASAIASVSQPLADPFRWSPDGARLAVLAAPTLHVVLPAEVSDLAADDAAWSPDSRYLAVVRTLSLFVYGADGAELSDRRWVAKNVSQFAWAP